MKIDLTFAHLHSPLFFAGKNWGEKLDIKNTAKGSIQLSYDRTEKELLIKSGGSVAIIPTSNVVSMTPLLEITQCGNVENPKCPQPVTLAPRGKIKAQVSGPNDHVHAGPGAGKINDK